jgi:hypothetical protein
MMIKQSIAKNMEQILENEKIPINHKTKTEFLKEEKALNLYCENTGFVDRNAETRFRETVINSNYKTYDHPTIEYR